MAASSPVDLLKEALSDGSLSERTFYPDDGPYQESCQSYFSNQARSLRPLCIIKPRSTLEVSTAVKTLSTLNQDHANAIKFVVRSGGHTTWPGASSIDGGVTIDLRSLNQVTVHEDHGEVTVGAGGTWADVYDALSPKGLTIPGGRVADVGVGGLVLGGGLSFFSPRKGFVCDHVVMYEMVLADGNIEQVSQESHPDLWWALKGGSGNFGIVTHLTMRSFPQGDIWGGCFVYEMSTAQQHLKAFHDFASAEDERDEHASVVSVYSFRENQGFHVFNTLVYTKAEVDPAPLKPFLNIAKPLYSTGRIATQAELTKEQAKLSPDNFQQCYMTTTFQNNPDMIQAAFEIWERTVANIQHVTGICWAIGFQVISPSVTRKSASLGGNCMGLENAPTMIIVLFTNFWKNADDSTRLIELTKSLVNEVETEAKRREVYCSYKYLNYAWKDQKPFEGYGEKNRETLRAISRRYDPQRTFQESMVGGFKLF